MASETFSMHPHGVKYTKPNEGVPDGSVGTGNAVVPNATYVYEWAVPERSGPADGDGSSVLWMCASGISSFSYI